MQTQEHRSTVGGKNEVNKIIYFYIIFFKIQNRIRYNLINSFKDIRSILNHQKWWMNLVNYLITNVKSTHQIHPPTNKCYWLKNFCFAFYFLHYKTNWHHKTFLSLDIKQQGNLLVDRKNQDMHFTKQQYTKQILNFCNFLFILDIFQFIVRKYEALYLLISVIWCFSPSYSYHGVTVMSR